MPLMRVFLVTILLILCVSILAFNNPAGTAPDKGVSHTLAYFKKQSKLFAASTANLQKQISRINSDDPSTIIPVKESLKTCRLQYKTIEFFLNYFLFSASTVYNQPNKVEVEEPFMEYHEPAGLQVIEAMLYDSHAELKKKELSEQIMLVHSSANDLNALLYNLNINDKQILESIRLELIRIFTLGITGYDAPELKTGISESFSALQSMKIILLPFLSGKSADADSVEKYLNEGLRLLASHPDFDSFNRMHFLIASALPLQNYLNLLIKRDGLELNTNGVLNYDTKNLFSADAIQLHTPMGRKSDLALLGQRLFFEKGLSGNATRNCASCHQPGKYFTDGLPKSITLDGSTTVQRNAPTLFYCADQYSQFWDGRAKSLDEQIITVLSNVVEMNGDHKLILARLNNTKEYVESFNQAFTKNADSAISISNVAVAITAYLKTLSPFNSPFDDYIRGNKNAIDQKQINGFNLFMGKAQCGTCHFAPVFNGLIPPLYKRTELEVLGTTSNTDFAKPELDKDSGRFASFPIEFYKGAFKTPSVRNAAQTAPYMHNGAFETLHDVLEFYNKGGGAGLGLKVPTQTLPSKPLKLSEDEMNDIIAFLHSLTDKYDFKK